jgi:ribosome maturation factor RimP
VAFLPDLEQQTAARLAELGFELVELRQGGSARRPLLQVRIERMDAGGDQRVTVDDCALASRALEAWLDGTGLGGGQYVLEVSSPGLDRPLRGPEEWRRFAGRQADVLVPALGGRFAVRIVQVAEDPEPSVELEFPKGVRRTVKLTEIKEARLAVEW